jgi:hypothetical protein
MSINSDFAGDKLLFKLTLNKLIARDSS